MVRWSVSELQPKQRLLSLAVDHALAHGIVDLSLREIAAAIGTSHRMLIYHFGSREGLLVAVVREVERRERDTLAGGAPSVEDSRQLWEHLADPAMWPQERLFFEIYSHALLNRPGTEGFLDEAITSWIDPITQALGRTGIDDADARAMARLGLAVTRGLLLDLLATRDQTGVTRAYELFMTLLESAQATAS
jgi:AcrR family transcriptional regulator